MCGGPDHAAHAEHQVGADQTHEEHGFRRDQHQHAKVCVANRRSLRERLGGRSRGQETGRGLSRR